MNKFFVLLFTSQIVDIYSGFTDENKYIDQLHEPEKQKFLERIVRRIAEEVDLKNVANSDNKNISDAELDKHSDFVKKIINEEKENYDKESKATIQENTEETIKEQRKMMNHSHIDLTLRERNKQEKKRMKRNENSELNDNSDSHSEATFITIPVKTVYDAVLNNESNPIQEPPLVEKNDIQVKGIVRPKTRRSTILRSSTTKPEDLITEADKAVSLDKSTENIEVSSTVTEASKDTKLTVTNSFTNPSTVVSTSASTAKVEKNIVRSDDSQLEAKSVNDGNVSDQNKVSKDMKQDIKSSSEDVLNDKSLKTSNIKMNENITILKKSDKEIPLVPKTNFIKLKNATKPQTLPKDASEKKRTTIKHETKHLSNNRKHDAVIRHDAIKTTTDLSKIDEKDKLKSKLKHLRLGNIAESKPIEIINENLNKSSDLVKKNETNISNADEVKVNRSAEISEEIKTLQIAENVVKALRMGIDRDTKHNRVKLKKNRQQSSPKNVNIYGLYDNSADNSYEGPARNQEQPFYVPVYNYYANNAYYNAYNKFGPNKESSKNRNKNKYQYIPAYSAEVSDLSLETYHRAFFRKPQLKNTRTVKANVDSVTFRNNVRPFSLLPSVAEKPHVLSLHDYDYLFGNDYLRQDYVHKTILKSKESRKRSNKKLKSSLKNIRESIFNYQEENKKGSNEREEEDNERLDKNIDYSKKKKSKESKSEQKSYSQFADYDYVGEAYNRDFSKKRFKNIALADILKSKMDLPTATEHPLADSREIATRVKKHKTMNKEMSQKFQEVFPLLKKLVKIIDFEEDKEVEACVRVMGDLIQTNNEGLDQYDWLESTVNIQSAISKLTELTTAARTGQRLHPSDLELLRYTTYIFSLASADKDEEYTRSTLPKSKKKKKRGKAGLEDRVWLYRIPDPGVGYEFDFKSFQKFLDDLADNLYDLHNAFKHIALVTTLKSQHWFKNLKDLYLHKPSRKQLLELVLHLGTTRLFNLIEDGSKKGIEDNFLTFIHQNQLEVSRVKDAFVFVLKVLEASLDNRLIENY